MKIFKGPKKPKKDPDQERLLKEQQERLKEQESEIARKRALAQNKGKGRASLISGAETGTAGPTGVPARDTTG